jgi:hypothetical protein
MAAAVERLRQMREAFSVACPGTPQSEQDDMVASARHKAIEMGRAVDIAALAAPDQLAAWHYTMGVALNATATHSAQVRNEPLHPTPSTPHPPSLPIPLVGGGRAQAEEHLARAVKLAPVNLDAWVELAECYWKASRSSSAELCEARPRSPRLLAFRQTRPGRGWGMRWGGCAAACARPSGAALPCAASASSRFFCANRKPRLHTPTHLRPRPHRRCLAVPWRA